MLTDNALIGFAATTDVDKAKAFYSEVLGLELRSDDGFALVYSTGGTMLRVVRAEEFTPLPFTVIGWEVGDVPAMAAELAARGVEFLRYPFFEQDDHGVWTAPNGDQVAWFMDPDGNTLSISHHQGWA